jgi:hypothetical protein
MNELISLEDVNSEIPRCPTKACEERPEVIPISKEPLSANDDQLDNSRALNLVKEKGNPIVVFPLEWLDGALYSSDLLNSAIELPKLKFPPRLELGSGPR